MREQTAKLRYLHIAPRKVRLIANTLKGLPTQEAEAALLLRPQRSSGPLLKLLRSAIANAKANAKMNPDALVVASVRVDQGPILKRSLPRAMGRATPIHKILSHVTITLAERGVNAQRFTITPPPKKEKRPEKKSAKAGSGSVGKRTSVKPDERPRERGFLKRFFTRKAV